MARNTIKFLKQQGQFDTRIASLVGCDGHTVHGCSRSRPTHPGGASGRRRSSRVARQC